MITNTQLISKHHLQGFADTARISTNATRAALNTGDTIGWLVGPLYTSFDLAADKHAKYLACKPGCSHCCSDVILAWPPEVLLVARTLRLHENAKELEDVLQELRQRVDEMADVTDRADYLRRKLECVFLVKKSQQCAIYLARPLACRAHNSLKEADCKTAKTVHDHLVPMDQSMEIQAAGMVAGMRDALFERGLKFYELDFFHALVFAMDTPDVEERWLAGEDVFKDVRRAVRAAPKEKEKVKLW